MNKRGGTLVELGPLGFTCTEEGFSCSASEHLEAGTWRLLQNENFEIWQVGCDHCSWVSCTHKLPKALHSNLRSAGAKSQHP